MPKRYEIPFLSLSAVPHTIEFHDTDFLGTVTEVDGAENGYSISHRGSAKDLFTPILTSNCLFQILITDPAEAPNIEPIINDLAAAPEERFFAVVREQNSIKWAGWIITDQVSFADQFYPYFLRIHATDGINRLKDIDYRDNVNDEDYSGYDSVLNILLNCIREIGLQDALGVGTASPILTHNVNWFEENMNEAADPLGQVYLNNDIFYSISNEGDTVYTSTFEVLKQICEKFGARFFLENGKYHFFQSAAYLGLAQKNYSYDLNGNQELTVTADFLTPIDYVVRHKINGVRHSFLPPIKKVTIDYTHQSQPNRSIGLEFPNGGEYEVLLGSIVPKADGSTFVNLKVPFTINSNIELQTGGFNAYPPHKYYFKVFLQVGPNYYERPLDGQFYDVTYLDGAWSSLERSIDLVSPLVASPQNGQDITELLEIITDPITFSIGEVLDIRLKIILEEVRGPGPLIIVPNGPFYTADINWSVVNPILTVEEEGSTGDTEDERRYCVSSEFEGNTIRKKVNTIFGDGPFEYTDSSLQLSDETITTNWRRGTEGDYVGIENLLGQEILSLHQLPARLMRGSFLAKDIDFRSNVVDTQNGLAYIPLTLNKNAFTEQVSGDFAQVNLYDLNIIVEPPLINPGGTGTGPSSPGQTGATSSEQTQFNIGISTGVLTDIISVTQTQNDNTPNTVNNPNAPNQLSINPVEFTFVTAGDRISIINPSNNQFETFTVATDYVPGQNFVEINEDIVFEYPPNSYLHVSPVSSLQPVPFTQKSENFSGEFWDITTGTLPDPATVSEDEIDRRVKVFRPAGRIFYNFENGFEIDVSGANNRIRFKPRCRGENVFIEVNG